MARKRLWTIDKKIMLEDRDAPQNEESDVIRGHARRELVGSGTTHKVN